MVSKLYKTDKRVLTLEALGTDVVRRRAVAGKNPEPPRNTGTRRTASKRALLKAIEGAGGKW